MTIVNYSNAAHTYGLDDPTGSTGGASAAILGALANTRANFDLNNPPFNTEIAMSLDYTGGFSFNATGRITGFTSGVVDTLSVTKAGTNETLLSVQGPININAANITSLFSPSLVYGGADTITGNNFNNVLRGWTGNDRIDGAGGTDTAVFAGNRASATVTKTASGFTVSSQDGVDTLLNIERLQFADQTIAYDTAGTAGQSYRLYQAAFNRTPDVSGLGFWTRSMDNGMSLHDVAQNFINSAEFSVRYGALNSTQFVTQLYANVLHRAPDATGLAFHVSSLNAGAARADVLGTFSESPENQAALIGTISNGMVYIG